MKKGLLLVLTDPTASLEEEFNAWYDTEHLPERKALPGFETALRFVCIDGAGPRYLALYDMENPEALDTPEYLAVSGEHFSPWTKRITGRTPVHRGACTQIHPGGAITTAAAQLILVRFAGVPREEGGAIVAGLRKSFEGSQAVCQVRVFHYELDGTSRFIGIAECRWPVPARIEGEVLGAAADHIDLVAAYRPY